MSLNARYSSQQANLSQLLSAVVESITYNLNCVKIAKIVEFDRATFTAQCQVMNKRLLGLNQDGTQDLAEYPLIYARVHNFGWSDIGATHPIKPGMEGFLLFNDRELQTWYKTGTNGQLAYNRCHDLSDALFICGIHSEPNIDMVQYLENAINIFYKTKNIQINENNIIINGDTVINGNLQVNGNINATGDIVAGSISLKNHVHTSGAPGSDTSAPKG